MGLFFKRLDGIYGSVMIPSIGLSIGTMVKWQLLRREDAPPGSGEWDLHASLSYMNKTAWESTGWEKEIRLTIGSPRTGKQYRLTQAENGRTVLEGQSLLIEGANLWPLES